MKSALFVWAAALSALLYGCGGASSGAVVPKPGGGAAPSLPSTLDLQYGSTIGTPGLFSPASGDAASGGNGQSVDGIPCDKTMYANDYHVHVFLGILHGGAIAALPYGAGMKNPGAPVNGAVNSASCFYFIHTHDRTGVIHLEDPSTVSRQRSLFTLGQFFDIWSQPFSSNGLGSWTGSIRVYTSGQRYAGQGSQTISRSAYRQYTGDPRSIALYAHEVIWIEIGPAFVSPSGLPSVHFTY